MKKNIKVKVTVTLNVDTESWLENFQVGVTSENIREDIKDYFIGLCQEQLEVIGCKAKPEPIQLTGWTRMA